MESNVVPISAHRETTPTEPSCLQVYQRIIREWGGCLNSFELILAMMIADRTIGWGKTRATFSTRRMLEGDALYTGLNMSRATLFRALASLERKGIIARHDHPEGKEIKVYSINLDWSSRKLDIPERPRDPSQSETTPSHRETIPVSDSDTRERNRGERNREKENYTVPRSLHGVAGSTETVRGKLGAATAAHRAAAERKASGKDTVAALETRWRLALIDAYPAIGHTPWTTKNKGLIGQKMVAWANAKQITFGDFVDWSVRNWSGVILKQLRWMTKSKPPKVPTVGFFVSFIDHFAECWASGKLDAWLASPERTEMARLLKRGMTPEQAAAEIGEARAVVSMKEENAKAEIEVRARYRQVQLAEQRVARMEVGTVDPRSLSAQGVVVPIEPMAKLAVVDMTPLNLDPNWEPPE